MVQEIGGLGIGTEGELILTVVIQGIDLVNVDLPQSSAPSQVSKR